MGAFPDPITAMEALAVCINPPRGTIICIGSLSAGDTIPCCDGHPVLQIETGMTLPRKGNPYVVLARDVDCGALAQTITVKWRECFVTNKGKAAMSAPDLSAMGRTVILSWWMALRRIACCEPTNSMFRFVSREDMAPEVCAGWTLTMECDVAFCEPCPS